MRSSKLIAFLIAVHMPGCSRPVPPTPENKKVASNKSLPPPPSPRASRKVVKLTDAAAEKFKAVLDGDTAKYIRLSVKNEGPTGFIYDLKVDETPLSDVDQADSSNGFQLVVDKRSSLFLEGATIDWETQPDGRTGFKFENPNALKQ